MGNEEEIIWQSYSWCRDGKFIVNVSSTGSTERCLNGDTESHKRWVEISWGTSEKCSSFKPFFLPVLESIILIAAQDDCHRAEKWNKNWDDSQKIFETEVFRSHFMLELFLKLIMQHLRSVFLFTLFVLATLPLFLLGTDDTFSIHDRLRRTKKL